MDEISTTTNHYTGTQTTHLRFVERDGHRILQQKWTFWDEMKQWSEWHDVPLEHESP